MSLLVLVGLLGCGSPYDPGPSFHEGGAFPLACAHGEVACEACHAPNEPLGPIDPACASCHLDERPGSHDPAKTGTCEECHVDSCGWDAGVNPHPPGFEDPDAHGLAANLQDPTEGDCRTCHGSDLAGGTAQGCDDCHAAAGEPDWRTDCVFCHGGVDDATGAPPQDIDNGIDPAGLSLASHHAHVDADGDYRASPCVDCHVDHTHVLTPDHTFDSTPGVSEVTFAGGPGATTKWDGNGTCTTSYCHGSGQRDDGVVSDDAAPMTCNSCHPTTNNWDTMSGFHETHLEDDDGIVCNDCHSAIIDRLGEIVTPARHVDGLRDVSFYEPTITTDDGGGTCTGACHGYNHTNEGWGHEQNFADAALHGRDANLQVDDCGACHGADWTGGIAQGCDDCHTTEGHPDWRTDCTFCHGGENGDVVGMPPQDIDDETDEELISFGSHFEHADAGGIGHPAYDCGECHVVPDDALSLGHALDATPGVAEVELLGLSHEGAYDFVSQSCSNLYCHGNGLVPSGTIADGSGALDCESCHSTVSDPESMSGTHDEHIGEGITCDECHAPVVDVFGQVITPALHVNRRVDLDEAAIGYDPTDETCTLSCHGTSHVDWYWTGPHPPGYDAPELHGQDSFTQALDCATCHGADLTGGSAQGCDDCHATEGHPDWRTDCTFCHGGEGGDVEGLPPSDLDNEIDEDLISFKSHPEHADGDSHPLWGCATCHGAASSSYTNAVTDPNHWFDSTMTVAEVAFTGIGAGTTYAARTCSNSTCHGNGQVPGAATDGVVALTCNDCHRYDFDLGDLSGTHQLHLGVAGVSCADCHGAVADAAGNIVGPARHVDGAVSVDATAGFDPATDTCTNTCHAHEHTDIGWDGGHLPGYDDPLVHGQDALLQKLDCATSGCHGTDLQGGDSGQGCDSCHTANWRQDCVYCHGGENGDLTGLPPQDIDNESDQDLISFKSHPEHSDGDEHPVWGCELCHGAASASYVDAFLDVDHWWDATPGVAEVDYTGLGAGATYVGNTCSQVYCHGNGRTDGSETDGTSSLSCTGCHDMPPDSGEHQEEDHDDFPCTECHADTSDRFDDIIGPNLHVNGKVDVDMASTNNVNWNGNTCNGDCHGEDHDFENW